MKLSKAEADKFAVLLFKTMRGESDVSIVGACNALLQHIEPPATPLLGKMKGDAK